MLFSITNRFFIWFIYLRFYSLFLIILCYFFQIINLSTIWQIIIIPTWIKIIIFIFFINISGIPPLIGFLPKLFIFYTSTFSSNFILIALILSSIFSSFVYFKIFSPFLLSFPLYNWRKFNLFYLLTIFLLNCSLILFTFLIIFFNF